MLNVMKLNFCVIFIVAFIIIGKIYLICELFILFIAISFIVGVPDINYLLNQSEAKKSNYLITIC